MVVVRPARPEVAPALSITHAGRSRPGLTACSWMATRLARRGRTARRQCPHGQPVTRLGAVAVSARLPAGDSGANGSAVLGSLANDYYDVLGEADFVVKERMYFGWGADVDAHGKRLGFDQMSTKVRQDLDVKGEGDLLRYAAGNVYFGSKGYSPISVQTSLHFLSLIPMGLSTSTAATSYLNDWTMILRPWWRSPLKTRFT